MVLVHPVLSLTVRRTGPLSYLFTGRVLPRIEGQLVTLYRLDGGRPVRTATAITDARGVFTLNRTFLGGGTFPFMVRTVGSMESAAGTSAPPYALTLR